MPLRLLKTRLVRVLPLLAAACCAASPAIPAQTATLTADAAVTSARPTTNYGTLSNLYVSGSSTALLRFDLGVLPGNITASQISRATLRLFVNRVNTPGVLTVSALNAAWAEATVTARTLPATGNAVEVFAVTEEGQYLTVDVTALVRGWITTPAQNFGLTLATSAADVVLDSKENDTTAHPAQLEIALASGATGPVGPQGLRGDTGLQGPAGVPGTVGATGLQGPKGDRGDPGPAGIGTGMVYRGAWDSATAYAASDVVTHGGAAWISLVTSNAGNTPGSSPSTWGVLVPAATSGSTIAGLLFAGAYSSATNYGTNQVVTWQNSTWVSLHDSNRGNTPAEATDWAVLVPAAVGLTGPQGARGDKGDAGLQGERGLSGQQGPQGERGATGTTGRTGFVYQGIYASGTNYAAGDVVLWQGGSWASRMDSNLGNTPDSSSTFWGPLTTRGLTGDTGAAGPQGSVGPQGVTGMVGPTGERGLTGLVGSTGPQGAPGRDGAQGTTGERGPVGPQGDPGPIGLTWLGVYASATNYAKNDAVAWQGQTWLSLHSTNHGNAPDTSLADWTLLAAAGAIGPQGPTGSQGSQGLQGSTGLQGPKGDTGNAGGIGPQGLPGMQFLGVYNSVANYALQDAVTYAGGTWLSLQAANHGNTPGTAVAWWQQLAAPGLQGPVGSQGIKGDTGNAGPTGSQGVAGPVGPQGQPVHFLGAWSGTANYATGDAVFYNGSAYIAMGSVTGNPPGVSPAWSLLAQQGNTGATGPQGLQGIAGPAGSTGPQGPTGSTGSVGMRWLGIYNPATGYATGDAVAYNGASYLSIADLNSGSAPGTTPQWSLLAAAGATGSAGVNGINGATGASGAAATLAIGSVSTGVPGSTATVQNIGTTNAATLNFTLPQGATGATGSPGLTYQGTWSSATGYSKDDVVFRNGSSYVSQTNTNTSDPIVAVATNTGDWKLLAAQGDPGPASVSIGTVTSGTTAAVANTGTSNAAVLNFTLPRGDTGATGPTGLAFVGAWNSATPYQPTEAVSYNGSSYIARAANTGVHPVGDAGSSAAWLLLAAQGSLGTAGPQGQAGLTGTAPTITIAGTHTGAAGTDAIVTNVGTATAIQLDFTIPQGAAGTGSSGGGVYSAVHTVPPANMGSLVYSPLVDTRASGDAFAVLGFLPSTCRVSSVLIYNSSVVDATFEVHTGTPGNMSVFSTSCTAKAGSATMCTGPGLLGANNFMSFGVTTTNTANSYLYTQFACN